ncbi:MAG: hypothetical protein MUC87_16680 [Bacteroidia bacterium]|jgi:hypothetical protein|nr:hypothetical protein [Bacteroidia bacterium]
MIIPVRIYFLLLFCIPFKLGAQISPQVFVANEGTEYNFLWFKNVDSANRVTLFNYTFYYADYNERQKNTYEIYQVGIYNLTPTWGLSAGGRFTAGEFVPLVALSYQVMTDDLYLNLFPSAQYFPSSRRFGYSLFGMLFYRPRINERWRGFSQLMFEPLFVGTIMYSVTSRLGLGLNTKTVFSLAWEPTLIRAGMIFGFARTMGFL